MTSQLNDVPLCCDVAALRQGVVNRSDFGDTYNNGGCCSNLFSLHFNISNTFGSVFKV